MGTRLNRLGETVLTCTHNLYFEQTYSKYQFLYNGIFNFYSWKKNQFNFPSSVFSRINDVLWSDVKKVKKLTAVGDEFHYLIVLTFEKERPLKVLQVIINLNDANKQYMSILQ